MGTKEPAPDSILECVHCKFQKGCKTRRCSCYKSDLKCTEMCQCNSCENSDILADELIELEAHLWKTSVSLRKVMWMILKVMWKVMWLITLASFPDEWKIARVIPLFKSGHRNMPENYRPISILPAISKIMEQILYNQLYNYLTEYGLLSSAQFGFRKSHSTATALLDCTNEWYMNIDKKMFNLVVFIDLKKSI